MDRWSRTHAALALAAMELFEEVGYDAATTAQVAARAGVSEMTLFRHFPSKEALVLDDPFDPLIADAVRARPAQEAAMRALVEGIRLTWADVDVDGLELLRARLRIVAASSTLRGAIQRNSEATITALQDALIDRDVDPTQATVAATAVVSGLSVALLEWAASDGADLVDVVGLALDTLGGH